MINEKIIIREKIYIKNGKREKKTEAKNKTILWKEVKKKTKAKRTKSDNEKYGIRE